MHHPAMPALAVAVAWLAIIWLWPASYLTLTVDDSFYYLQVARNLAAGHGPTFDQVSLTNGFHPLWMALLVPIVRLGGPSTGTVMRLVLTIQVGLVFAGTLTLARTAPAGRRFVIPVAALLDPAAYRAHIGE